MPTYLILDTGRKHCSYQLCINNNSLNNKIYFSQFGELKSMISHTAQLTSRDSCLPRLQLEPCCYAVMQIFLIPSAHPRGEEGASLLMVSSYKTSYPGRRETHPHDFVTSPKDLSRVPPPHAFLLGSNHSTDGFGGEGSALDSSGRDVVLCLTTVIQEN